MREIKFRAKGNDEQTKNRWFYGSYYITRDTTYCFRGEEHLNNIHHYILFDEMTDWGLPNKKLRADIEVETLGQYTGLKDVNGKEIYEGDIVAEHGHYVKSDKVLYQKVQWKESYSCWLRGEFQRLTPKNIKQYKIEVVGNIYENPELLKG